MEHQWACSLECGLWVSGPPGTESSNPEHPTSTWEPYKLQEAHEAAESAAHAFACAMNRMDWMAGERPLLVDGGVTWTQGPWLSERRSAFNLSDAVRLKRENR